MMKISPPGIHTASTCTNTNNDACPAETTSTRARRLASQAREPKAATPAQSVDRLDSTGMGAVPVPARTQLEAVGARVSTVVAADLRKTVGWEIEVSDIQVQAIDRRSFRQLMQEKQNHGINYVQAWILAHVVGVAYVPSLKKVVVVDEITRSWHPKLLQHEIAKSVVRLCLERYSNQQKVYSKYGPSLFESHMGQIHYVDHRYLRSVRSMAVFHAAHAESVARRHYPKTHTEPLQQRLWGILVGLTIGIYYKVRTAGRMLADRFDDILKSHNNCINGTDAPGEGAACVNRIYAHGLMASLWDGGLGKIPIDVNSKATERELTNDAALLLSLNPHRGRVVPQFHSGPTGAFAPEG